MTTPNIFETYLKQIATQLSQNNYPTALELCLEMRSRLLANPPVDPAIFGWQRYYHFLCMVRLDRNSEALDLFMQHEDHPFVLDRTQTAYMTSVAAELACAAENASLTLKLSRLAWTSSFHDPEIIARVQKAQNACIYFERLKQNRLNFGFARFLTGFGKSNDIPVLYVQGLECLLANYRQSSSLTVAAILLNSLGDLAGYLERLPDNLDRLRLVELVDSINKIPGTITVSGQFNKAVSLLTDNRLTELAALIKQYPQVINENDETGLTLLFKAIQNDNFAAVEMLIEKDSDLHRCEAVQGASPLLIAVNLGNPRIVKALLDGGADPEIKGIFGATPLIRAVIEEHYDVLALLLEYGVLLDRRDDSGNTALMHAVEDGSIEAVKSLISAGADLNMKNQAGLTLLQIAEDAEEPELVEFFKQLNGNA
ncbi:MAG: ankyrin repeat domain-containing protein [Candidatus Riflebacteria bacterium]|nr:ankyrin repeat domain-containing protein [Candidatus Riflebacteria bacterium]